MVAMQSNRISFWRLCGICYIACLVRSLLIPLSFEIVRYIWKNPNYTSAHCLMKLVNETDPTHFGSHLFYQDLVYDDECDIEQYVLDQYSHNEYRYLNSFFLALAIAGIVSAVSDWRNVLSYKFLGVLFAGYQLSQLHHCFSHFGQDISFFAGNILHHSNTSRYIDQSNASFVDNVPQGFALTIIITVTWACIVRALLPAYDPILSKHISWRTLFFSNVICGFLVAYQVKVAHPELHRVANEQMSSALPFSWEYTAYRHVYGHHTTGEWFGPHPLIDPCFSVALRLYAYLHNTLLGLQLHTLPHYIFAVGFDSVLSMVVVCCIWATLRLVALFLEAVERCLPKSIGLKEA
mmetsp:Transcript_8539/g.12746  ORF Transcript_8539/g.12746 Transcript_8539/m.12746 type:complete len:350 (+) Transcript_8539:61-1110(+)